MPTQDGLPSAGQIITFADPKATLLKTAYALMGLNAPGESGTLAVAADADRIKSLGDGNANPGLGTQSWIGLIATAEQTLARVCRYDVFFQAQMRLLMASLDTVIGNNLPKSWQFKPSSTQAHAFDMWLSRLNAVNPLTPAIPAAAGVLTGVYNANGALSPVASGNAPRVAHTLIYQDNNGINYDWIESLSSAQATQEALTGNQNAYTYAIPGTVPANAGKVRLSRGYYAGGANIYFWDQDVLVTPGGAYPTIYILQPDSGLRIDIAPPSFLQCLMVPEFGALFALAYSSSRPAQGRPNAKGLPGFPQFATNGMLSALNVALGLSNGFVGVGNQVGAPSSGVSTSQFGVVTITGAAAMTWAPNTPYFQATNAPALNVQGFAGAVGLQSRVLTTISGTGTVNITYHYLDATHGQSLQSATINSGAFGGTAAGSVATFTIPSVRLITQVTVNSVAGMGGAGGTLVIEATPARVY